MSVARRPSGAPALDVEAVRRDFPILDRRDDVAPVVYLDSAATSQKPRVVLDAEREFYERHCANAHRGLYRLAEEATVAYEGARAAIARFVGASDPATIVSTRGTTEAINLVAHAWGRRFLKEGDEILLTHLEHHANIVPWQLCARDTGAVLRYVPITDDGLLDLDALPRLIGPRTKLLGVTGMSNALGTIPPVATLVAAARSVGALVLLDGAQSVPHLGTDVGALDVDFLAFSGHKMLGPTASGGLYAKREHLEAMDPFLGGGEMIREVYEDHSTWNEVPQKFEAGTMNLAQQVGLGAAIGYLEGLGMEAVRAHEQALTAYALGVLDRAGARVLGPTDVGVHGGAISFLLGDVHPHDLATILDEEHIAIRAGHHCAQLVMRHYGVSATARVSFSVYSTEEEVDALGEALGRAKAIFGEA
ncbi:MAG: SufS family cysteine desulfurase [Actinomycetota bacterium]